MTNGEYNKDKILEMCDTDVRIAIGKDGEIQSCKEIGCRKCVLFDSSLSCQNTRIKWLYEERKEDLPKLTKQEHGFCVAVGEGYIARDKNKKLFYYHRKPIKYDKGWSVVDLFRRWYEVKVVSPHLKFDFIKWEDEEPWSVEDLLKLEVEVIE